MDTLDRNSGYIFGVGPKRVKMIQRRMGFPNKVPHFQYMNISKTQKPIIKSRIVPYIYISVINNNNIEFIVVLSISGHSGPQLIILYACIKNSTY
jgi:hypothetical protein